MSPVYVFEELRLPLELLAAALVFLIPLAEKKPRFPVRAAGAFLFLALLSLLYFPIFLDKESPRLQALTVFWYCLLALTAAGFARFCFRISMSDSLLIDIAAFLTQNIVYCVYHCFIARILFPVLRLHLPLYMAGALLVSCLVCAPVYFLFRDPLRSCRGIILNDSRESLISLGLFFLVMMICLFFYQGVFDRRISSFDSLAWLSGVILCLLMLVILYSIVLGVVRFRENTVLESMLRSGERCYDLSREHIAIINRKCHDLKHQLKVLAAADESQRAEYLAEAQRSILFYQHLVYTENEALNTILAEKGLFCQEKDIAFNCSVDDADLSFIRLPDLYALLGNAIDNAIEYVQDQEDPNMRTISMRIEGKHQFIGIQVINPYAGEPLSSDSLPRTHKKDAWQHGFGMQSIRYLAEKYGGSMEFSTDRNLFTLQVLLPRGGK